MVGDHFGPQKNESVATPREMGVVSGGSVGPVRRMSVEHGASFGYSTV